ncbi:hypothetical protein C6P44_002288, partial [Monosporozyma unispora]
HAIHHDTLKKTEIPAGLEEIISSQNCYQFSNLMDLLVKNGGFSEYLNNATSTETNEIKRFWNKHVESRWIRDDDALISAGKLLSDGTLNHVKLLELKESTTTQESMPSLAIYFDYGNIDKSLFTKAAIDATYNPSQNLKQCFVVVGELNGEDWGKKEDLTNFLSKVLNLGYIFQYVTTDIDYANVTAIHYSFGDAKVQFCLWHLKRAISNNTILQQDQANSRSYEFIKNYSWFDLYGDFLKKIYDYVLIENDVDLTTYETNIYLWLCQC